MSRPILKLGLAPDRPAATLELTPMQHAAVELAIKFLIERIDAKDYAQLEDATVRAFGELRSNLFGVQAQLRCANIDARLQP